LISTRSVPRKSSSGSKATRSLPRRVKETKEPKGARKNPRILTNLVSQGHSHYEAFLETASPEEIVRIFEESYCSSIVNFLLDLKKSTAKRILETVVRAKKRSFLNVITLYYYKDYLTNPLPLTLPGEVGEIPNHYAILGVPREISDEEVKVAYKLLSSSFNIDSFPPAERRTREERLREITEAFEVLKSPKRRKDFDDTLPNISYLYPRRDQSWFEAVNRMLG
jgi:hypothetical protein